MKRRYTLKNGMNHRTIIQASQYQVARLRLVLLVNRPMLENVENVPVISVGFFCLRVDYP
jgi:hypothetical protein